MKHHFLLFVLLLSFHAIQAQPCDVTITSIQSMGPGNPPPAVHIQVTGKVSSQAACPRVRIELCCKDNPSACRTQFASVQADNTWSTLFKDFVCPCINGSFTVHARAACASTDQCTGSELDKTVDCPPQPPGCPVINGVTTAIGNCIQGQDGCQKRQVTFTPNVSGTCDGFSWNFGDNTSNNGVGNPVPIMHEYDHFPQAIPMLTIFKVGCTPQTFNIPLPNFAPCASCPAANQINLNQLTINKCHLTGTIGASICFNQFVSFIIDFGDGNSTPTVPIAQLSTFAVDHTYACDGSYVLKLSLIDNISNCLYQRTIAVTSCSTCTGGNDDDDGDDCFFCICGVSIWCCIAYILFILALIAMMVSLSIALCNGNTAAWVAFGISLALVIALILFLIFRCHISICELLLALAAAGTANWGIICGTSIVPCTSWLCKKVTLPILGPTQNFLIVAVALWLLALIFCKLL